MKNISHSSCSTDILLQKVYHRYRTVTPLLNKNRGHRQFKGNGSVCLHSRASSTLLKWSNSQCLWVLEAYNLCVLLWRAIDHLLGGKGYRVIVGKGWGCAVVNKRTPPPRIAITQNPWGRRRRRQGADTLHLRKRGGLSKSLCGIQSSSRHSYCELELSSEGKYVIYLRKSGVLEGIEKLNVNLRVSVLKLLSFKVVES